MSDYISINKKGNKIGEKFYTLHVCKQYNTHIKKLSVKTQLFTANICI